MCVRFNRQNSANDVVRLMSKSIQARTAERQGWFDLFQGSTNVTTSKTGQHQFEDIKGSDESHVV